MKITLHQTHHTVGDFAAIRDYLEQTFASDFAPGIHLFAELFLCGYPLQDLVLQRDFIDSYAENLRLIDIWCQEKFKTPSPTCILLGGLAYTFDEDGLPLTIENCIYEAHPGKPLRQVYTKKLLPNYDIFDEEKYFTPGRTSGLWQFEGKTFGLMICEDMWTSTLHPVDPISELALECETQSVQVAALFNLSASPFHLGKLERRIARASEISKRFGAPFFYVNRIGGEDEILFDGHSFIAHGDDTLYEAAGFKVEVATHELPALKTANKEVRERKENTWESLFAPRLTHDSPPKLTALSESDCAELIRSLGFGLHDYARKCGFHKYTIALSGGIDSALVLTLIKLTMPKDWQVEALFMPGLYTAGESYDLAQSLCQNLGVKLTTVPIKFFHTTMKNSYQGGYGLELDGLANENIQARLRGTFLYARSNHSGSMVVNTSNKSEIAVGYSTQYGDSVGAISLLGDLYKSEVYVLCHYINKHYNNIMPSGLITRLPTAELREDQHDQQSLPPYEELDAILEGLLSYRLGTQELVSRGFSRGSVEKVFRLYSISEYKRTQFCPIIKVRPKSFGFGHRIPITKKLTPTRNK